MLNPKTWVAAFAYRLPVAELFSSFHVNIGRSCFLFRKRCLFLDALDFPMSPISEAAPHTSCLRRVRHLSVDSSTTSQDAERGGPMAVASRLQTQPEAPAHETPGTLQLPQDHGVSHVAAHDSNPLSPAPFPPDGPPPIDPHGYMMPAQHGQAIVVGEPSGVNVPVETPGFTEGQSYAEGVHVNRGYRLDLPPGWDVTVHEDGRPIYIDHNTQVLPCPRRARMVHARH